jgi:hypothetical protein
VEEALAAYRHIQELFKRGVLQGEDVGQYVLSAYQAASAFLGGWTKKNWLRWWRTKAISLFAPKNGDGAGYPARLTEGFFWLIPER